MALRESGAVTPSRPTRDLHARDATDMIERHSARTFVPVALSIEARRTEWPGLPCRQVHERRVDEALTSAGIELRNR